jgi:hypothetical protein
MTTVEFPVPLTERAEEVLAAAAAQARAVGANGFIGVEHIFLAIMGDPDAVPTQVVERLGYRDRVLEELLELLNSETYRRST